MSTDQRFVERWPELFAGLPEREVAATVRALAAMRADGLEPEFEDVKALTDVCHGAMTHEGYLVWARERARVLAARGQ